jgi:DNA polymerase III sliding clamp (beta) subunit (PCNA family)
MADTITTTSVQVDGDKLAAAFRRVTPFMSESAGHPELCAVYAESTGGNLELTASDGYRIAHLSVTLPFPEGRHLLAAKGCKDFSQRAYQGQMVNVVADKDFIMVGEVKVECPGLSYFDYPAVLPDDFKTEVLIDPKAWIKAIRKYDKAITVGVDFTSEKTMAYFQNDGKETIGHELMPVQTYLGPAQKVSFNSSRLRRAITFCGDSCNIQIADGKPIVLEGNDCWHRCNGFIVT